MSKVSSDSLAKMKEVLKAVPSVIAPGLDTVFVAPIGVPLPQTGFGFAMSLYPPRAGGYNLIRAERQWIERIKEGCKRDDMLAGVKRYAEFCKASGIAGTHRVKAAEDFFGRYQHFMEAWSVSSATSKSEKMVSSALSGAAAAKAAFHANK
jgi:hypothetical protein